eukprot:s324_g20.t1
MRARFLAQERSDIAESVKRLAQGMSKPRVAHWEMLKRLARYLIFTPGVCLVSHQPKMPDFIRTSVDSDFAGDKVGRRSTTGMAQFYGMHFLKATSNLQSVLGLQRRGPEGDSSSAKAFASRRGLGKHCPVQVRFLWLQQAVSMHQVIIRKIGTSHNCSDILTTASDAATIKKHMQQMGLENHELYARQKTIH